MKRNYAVDLLKIVSMYMIAILHVLGQGGILNNLEVLSLKYNLLWLLEIICYVSVDCYAIITGYLMVESNFKYKKIINLWSGVLFWSVLLTLVMKLLFPDMIGKKAFFKSFFPVVFNSYWYFTSYFGLFLFIPFINKLINSMEKNIFRRLILTIVCLFCFINIIGDVFKLEFGYSFLWLVSCYFIGAYIRKYGIFKNLNLKILFLISLFCFGITLGFRLLLIKYPILSFGIFSSGLLISYNSFTIVLAAVCIFVMFLRLNITNKYLKRFIRRLVPATFGVYIIHVHPQVWNLVMKGLFSFILNYNTFQSIFLVLCSAFILYMICSYLEMFRLHLFKKLRLNRLGDYIYIKLRNIMRKLKII